MKIVIAIDSFKGSMSSLEAGFAAKKGIEKVKKDAIICVKPLADGGEGTTEALTAGLGGELFDVEVTGPLGGKVNASYGMLEDETCVMEMASAAGITLVDRDSLNPDKAGTYGVGEMICDAVEKGAKNFIIGIGGSATTDGGTGMLRALGFRFLKADGTEISDGIEELDQISEIVASKKSEIVCGCNFEIACDVENPLCGKNGAVAVFGPQKGVDPDKIDFYDAKMRHFAKKTAEFFGVDKSEIKGTGAAGGLGFAFLSYFKNARLRPGTDIVLDAIGLREEIKDADVVVTGEGRLDGQTAMGKVPVGVARLAKEYNKKVVAFAGGVTEDAAKCNDCGIDAFFPIVRGVTTLEEAMDTENAKKNMSLAVEQVFRLI